MDHSIPAAQRELTDRYFKGYIPHVVVIDRSGKALYNESGEVDEELLEKKFAEALK